MRGWPNGWRPALRRALMLSATTAELVATTATLGDGKTRLVAEVVRLAKRRGVEVFSTFCESHATDIPFHVAARLLRAVGEVSGLDDASARAQVRTKIPGADPEDMLLLDDLLGIADPGWELAKIDPDARRRRLTALINTAQLDRSEPAVFVIEDVHWIDQVSEAMLADFQAVIPHTHSLVLITYRPGYQGRLRQVAGAQTIALAALTEAQTATLVADLLGPDPAVGAVGEMIVKRAGYAYRPTHHAGGMAWRADLPDTPLGLAELRRLRDAAGDKTSLTIAMAGLVVDHGYQDRFHEASQLASEAMAILESIGDPTWTVILSWAFVYAKMEAGQWSDALRWAQAASGPPWRSERWLDGALDMARTADPLSYAVVVSFVYQTGILLDVRTCDDAAIRDIEDAVRDAERSGDDYTLAKARQTLGLALAHRHTAAERDRGQQLRTAVSAAGESVISDIYPAREEARRSDRDDAIAVMPLSTG